MPFLVLSAGKHLHEARGRRSSVHPCATVACALRESEEMHWAVEHTVRAPSALMLLCTPSA